MDPRRVDAIGDLTYGVLIVVSVVLMIPLFALGLDSVRRSRWDPSHERIR